MKIFEKESDMPYAEIENGDGTVEHLVCEGSRRHVISWDRKGIHCSEPRCEINKRMEGQK
jgi:predicted GNAT family N-acyltransferase